MRRRSTREVSKTTRNELRIMMFGVVYFLGGKPNAYPAHIYSRGVYVCGTGR